MFIIGGKDTSHVHVYRINSYTCIDTLSCKPNLSSRMLLDHITSSYSARASACVTCPTSTMGPLWLACRCPAPTDDTVMYITDHTHSASHLKFNSLSGPQLKLQHYTVQKHTLYSTVGLPYFKFLYKQTKMS